MRSVAALSVLLLAEGAQFEHSTLQLKSAKRDFGVAAVGDRAYFAGGCEDSGSTYSCNSATDDVEIFTGEGRVAEAKLSAARGWTSGCTLGEQILFAGGGSSDHEPRLATVDIFDAKTLDVKQDQLSVARWGTACSTLNGKVYFAGGISQSKGYLDVVDEYSPKAGVSVSDYRLSVARESIGVVATSEKLILAGGWTQDSVALKVVDVMGDRGHELDNAVYWPGVASKGKSAFLVDGHSLHHFDGQSWERLPLPKELQGDVGSVSYEGGGAVPNAHIPANGVAIAQYVCFYGYVPKKLSAVYCYDTESKEWQAPLPCSKPHKAGGIAAAGKSIFVAGGYDERTTTSTDVIDVFTLGQELQV